MSRGKKKPVVPHDDLPAQEEWDELGVDPAAVATEEMNTLMSTYRVTTLPTPVLLWRTQGKSVAAYELTQDQFDRIAFILGIEAK